MATTVTYKGQVLVTVDNSTKVLETSGTWCEDDFTLVDVSGGGAGQWTTDGIADGSEPNGAITLGDTVTSVRYGAFYGTPITSINFNKATTINDNACYGCNSLTTVTAPEVTNIKASAFQNCTALQSISFSKKISSVGNNIFNGCSNLANIDIDFTGGMGSSTFRDSALIIVVIKSATNIGNSSFYGCTHLTTADWGLANSHGNSAYQNCSSLTTVIMRSPTMATLGNINVFSGTPFASGGTGGTLYVPSALISSYQSASNWSTILGYANNQIKAIEGSIYETKYADGTPIS